MGSVLVLISLQDACIELAKTKGKFENGIVSLQGMQSITCVSRELIHVDAASGISASTTAACFICLSTCETRVQTVLLSITIRRAQSQSDGLFTCAALPL